jgi:hypothetical protein
MAEYDMDSDNYYGDNDNDWCSWYSYCPLGG